MKIGITADLHLKNANETKERYEALNQILNILQNQDISHLVIAGDLLIKMYIIIMISKNYAKIIQILIFILYLAITMLHWIKDILVYLISMFIVK